MSTARKVLLLLPLKTPASSSLNVLTAMVCQSIKQTGNACVMTVPLMIRQPTPASARTANSTLWLKLNVSILAVQMLLLLTNNAFVMKTTSLVSTERTASVLMTAIRSADSKLTENASAEPLNAQAMTSAGACVKVSATVSKDSIMANAFASKTLNAYTMMTKVWDLAFAKMATSIIAPQTLATHAQLARP